MKGILPTEARERIEPLLSQGYVFVTADPFLARAFGAETGSSAFMDIYTWALQRCSLRQPNPIDLLEGYEAGLRAIGITVEGSFSEEWEAAQRFGRDWEEVLQGSLSIQEAYRYWSLLSEHRLIQAAFHLYEGDSLPTWLRLLPFPYKSPRYTRTFWKSFTSFLRAYEDYLKRHDLAFAEEALHRLLTHPMRWEKTIFIHLYSSFPLMEAVLRLAPERGAEVWGWDLHPLRKALPEVWESSPLPHKTFCWPSCERKVSIQSQSTFLEVIKEAAEAIINYFQAHPDGRIGVWCEGEGAPLLRFFLAAIGKEKLSPESSSLWETTQVGQFLRNFMPAGLAGTLTEWPEIDATLESPAEQWVMHLYKVVQKRLAAPQQEAWQILLHLLQSQSMSELLFPAEVQVYIGRLTQLAGGCYDALFIIEPPTEPLGSWHRPSFWIPSVRRLFYPPQRHHQLAWRLLSLLLWGSKEIHIWRRSDPAYISAVEEFLIYKDYFGLETTFEKPHISQGTPVRLPSSHPIEGERIESPPALLSPSYAAQFLVCPRRFYWSQVLKDRSLKEAPYLGRLLHELIGSAFRRPSSSFSLYRLAHRLSKRRLYYRLSHLPLKWNRRYHLLRPLLAGAGQPLLHTLLALLYDRTSLSPLRQHLLRLYRHTYCQVFPEMTISDKSCGFEGRVDLLIEAKCIDPFSGVCEEKRVLLDFKTAISKEASDPKKLTEALQSSCRTLQNSAYQAGEAYRDSLFQILLYAWMLHAKGRAPDKIALVSLWWRPARRPTQIERLPYESYQMTEIQEVLPCIAQVWETIRSYIAQGLPKGSSAFPMTKDLQACHSCDFALLCDRLS
ncbi:MAG: PD-(D/E)XK nuclease family protein [Bacteroidia bacterium]|nr:PD-(D/E)XK nuclease family protein [Bacteroidia bacterium]